MFTYGLFGQNLRSTKNTAILWRIITHYSEIQLSQLPKHHSVIPEFGTLDCHMHTKKKKIQRQKKGPNDAYVYHKH